MGRAFLESPTCARWEGKPLAFAGVRQGALAVERVAPERRPPLRLSAPPALPCLPHHSARHPSARCPSLSTGGLPPVVHHAGGGGSEIGSQRRRLFTRRNASWSPQPAPSRIAVRRTAIALCPASAAPLAMATPIAGSRPLRRVTSFQEAVSSRFLRRWRAETQDPRHTEPPSACFANRRSAVAGSPCCGLSPRPSPSCPSRPWSWRWPTVVGKRSDKKKNPGFLVCVRPYDEGASRARS